MARGSLSRFFVAWFTYDVERPDSSVPSYFGDAGHRWLTAEGIYHTYTATLQIYNTSGLIFLDNAVDPITDPYGEMEIRFEDCGKGVVRFNIPSINQSGEVPIHRLTTDSQIFCEQLLSADLR